MNRLEYFSKVISIVAELTEVTDQDILGGSKSTEVVDARWMVICLMHERGYSAKQIAPLVCHPIRTINHALSRFADRVKYSYNNLGNNLAIARQMLSNI